MRLMSMARALASNRRTKVEVGGDCGLIRGIWDSFGFVIESGVRRLGARCNDDA